MRAHTQTLSAIVAAGVIAAVAVLVGQTGSQPGRQREPNQMSMGDMMSGCREHCERTSKSMDAMASAIETAKQSQDASKIRDALDGMQKPMADMKEHMSMCMRMMNMMQMMHGKGGMMSQLPSSSEPGGTEGTVQITFTSQPDPVRIGDNTFEVTVKGSDGKPVTNADVAIDLYMAATPSMNVPAMRNTIRFKHLNNGRYRGTGRITMAGRWDASVIVTRAGKEMGRRKLVITVK